jgi:hypothetical protein
MVFSIKIKVVKEMFQNYYTLKTQVYFSKWSKTECYIGKELT